MTYTYHPYARRELDDAADYYDSIDLKLGDGFLEEIDDCISRILMFPLAWTKLHGSVRRCRTHRFPYSLVYDLERGTSFHRSGDAFQSRTKLLGG